MAKHVAIFLDDDSRINVHGEILFDPQEKTLHVLGSEGAQATFNWNKIQFFTVYECEECE